MTIWKYPVYPHEFSHMMPQGAKFLSVQAWQEDAQMWFSIDPGFQVCPGGLRDERVFRVVAAGEEYEGNLEYLGTFQTGRFVFHLFEKK